MPLANAGGTPAPPAASAELDAFQGRLRPSRGAGIALAAVGVCVVVALALLLWR
jgi:hypothetical protein